MLIESTQRRRGLNLSTSLAVIIIILLMPRMLLAAQFGVLQHPGIRVQYESPLKGIAEEVVESYPIIKMNLVKTFGWEIAFRPTVVLIQDRQLFQRHAGNAPIVGYAVPGNNLIVIDCSRLHIRPHRLDNVLKHEMVHLMLHHHIRGGRLPRWLDEGVAQRISDGIAELLVVPRRSVFQQALLTGEYIQLQDLAHGFPVEKKYLILAYEESRSFVDFIVEKYGESALFEILEFLKDGSDLHQAFTASLDASPEEIEARWIRHQQKRSTWFAYLAAHIYEFLFLMGALLTIAGFIRFIIKKRNYKDEEDDDE
jgi:hypothetical protein